MKFFRSILLHWRIGTNQLVTGCSRSSHRRFNRCITSKPPGADCDCIGADCLCHEPFRILGTQTSLLADPGSLQILYRVFWLIFHGNYVGRSGGTLHRSLRAWASHLDSHPWRPFGWICHFFHPEPGVGHPLVRSGNVFRATGKTAQIR